MTKKRFIKLMRSFGVDERRIKKAVEEVQANSGRASYKKAILAYMYGFIEVCGSLSKFCRAVVTFDELLTSEKRKQG